MGCNAMHDWRKHSTFQRSQPPHFKIEIGHSETSDCSPGFTSVKTTVCVQLGVTKHWFTIIKSEIIEKTHGPRIDEHLPLN
jgi:hypothetical protein